MEKFVVIVNDEEIAEFDTEERAEIFCDKLKCYHEIQKKEIEEQKYESVFILNKNMKIGDFSQFKTKLYDIINQNGNIETFEEMGNRKLAYDLKGQNEGFYIMVKFVLKKCNFPEKINDLEKYYRNNKNVLKWVIVHLDN